jgi:hypothetical protein
MKRLSMFWVFALAAQAAPAQTAETADAAATPARRSAVSVDLVQREQAIAAGISDDRYLWLDAAAQQGLLIHRPARGRAAAGALLLLVPGEQGAGHNSVAGQLRVPMSEQGWHTYLLGLPPAAAEDQRQARLTGALAVLRGVEGRKLLFAEGSAAAWVAARVGQLDVDGLVLVNLAPPFDRSREPALLSTVETPTLVLQLAPVRWHGDPLLGTAVELHLLPRLAPGRAGVLVERRLRGWLARRFKPVDRVARAE